MNKVRRKRIAAISKQLEDLKEQFIQLEILKGEIEELQTEEQEAYDNLPEGLQQADKGQDMEHAAEALGDAVSQIDDVISATTESIDELLTALGAAAGEA